MLYNLIVNFKNTQYTNAHVIKKVKIHYIALANNGFTSINEGVILSFGLLKHC